MNSPDPTGPAGVAIVESSAALAESFHACLDLVAKERRWLLMLEAPPLAEVQAFVARILERRDAQLFALDGSRVVGWCDIQSLRAEGMRHAGVVGMGLLPEYRGRGLGRRLLDGCVARAREQGLSRIQLGVWASNAAAVRLYERSGFEREGVRRRARYLDGEWDDLIEMALLFPGEPAASG